jgi:nitrogen fixation/metabolism regulation signal transduction histidine kinase
MAGRASRRHTTVRQLKKSAAAPKPRGIAVEPQSQSAAQESLTRAFLTFTQAAGSLEKSYAQLQAEVSRLSHELQRANSELDRSLEENARMRGYLSRVLESLPCGVLVLGADHQVRVVNPEAQRLLGFAGTCGESAGEILPEAFAKKIAEISGNKAAGEQEWAIAAGTAQRYFGITRADVSIPGQSEGDTIWIVRDVTEAKRVAAEREAARRSNALAEVATVLAHEIRNPLGSMELFTGLLADATAHMPETRQWVTHLQAGLRALSATTLNMVQ